VKGEVVIVLDAARAKNIFFFEHLILIFKDFEKSSQKAANQWK
jgi:hypothetical protein